MQLLPFVRHPAQRYSTHGHIHVSVMNDDPSACTASGLAWNLVDIKPCVFYSTHLPNISLSRRELQKVPRKEPCLSLAERLKNFHFFQNSYRSARCLVCFEKSTNPVTMGGFEHFVTRILSLNSPVSSISKLHIPPPMSFPG